MNRATVLALAVALHLSAPLRAQIPRVTATSNTIHVLLPRAVLLREEVRSQLTNGLTTVFVIGVTTESSPRRARIEIRYELWDEKYLADVYEVTGHRSVELPDFDRLLRWWEQVSLVFPGRVRAATGEVTIDVLPFSAREAADVRKWLAGSMTKAQAAASGLATELPQPEGATRDDFFGILIGTSMKRRPIVELRWKVPITAEAR